MGILLNYNRKIVERGKISILITSIHDSPLCRIVVSTSIKKMEGFLKVVRNDININELERLFDFTLTFRHKFK